MSKSVSKNALTLKKSKEKKYAGIGRVVLSVPEGPQQYALACDASADIAMSFQLREGREDEPGGRRGRRGSAEASRAREGGRREARRSREGRARGDDRRRISRSLRPTDDDVLNARFISIHEGALIT